jgi:hypothetical protein
MVMGGCRRWKEVSRARGRISILQVIGRIAGVLFDIDKRGGVRCDGGLGKGMGGGGGTEDGGGEGGLRRFRGWGYME